VDSFVIRLWDRILSAARWLSPLHWIWRLRPALRTYGWVDAWVLLNPIVAGVTLILVTSDGLNPLKLCLMIYAAIRLLEVTTYQARVVLLDPYNHPGRVSDYALRSYRRTVVLALHNYVEAVIWFAAAYSYLRDSFVGKDHLATPIGALYYSMVTMTTVGYGDIAPNACTGQALVIAHLLVAVFMTLVIFARIIAFLPRPKTLDETEKDTSS